MRINSLSASVISTATSLLYSGPVHSITVFDALVVAVEALIVVTTTGFETLVGFVFSLTVCALGALVGTVVALVVELVYPRPGVLPNFIYYTHKVLAPLAIQWTELTSITNQPNE